MSIADEWEQVISYLEGVKPGFSHRIRPASGEQIAQYEGVIGRALFRPYRRYLELMGEFDDELFVETCGFSETIERMIERATEVRDEECGAAFFDSFLELGASQVAVLGLRVSGDDAGHVVFLNRCTEDVRHQHLADSLVNLAFYCGFVRELNQTSSQSATLSAPPSRKTEVLQCLKGRFQAEKYSDSVKWYGRQTGLLALVRSRREEIELAFTARSLSRSISEAEEVAQILGLAAPKIENA